MWDFILRPLAWTLAVILGLLAWWLVTRLLFKAYYRSRFEYYQQIKKGTDDRRDKE